MKTVNKTTKKEIIVTVRNYIKKYKTKDWPLEILEVGVHRDDGWWYVPVRPMNITNRNILYYDLLAKIETAIQDKEHLNVLLIPSAPDK